jgi:membrane-associated phospholipid phosphatase
MRGLPNHLLAIVIAAGSCLCGASSAAADDGERLEWSPRFSRFSNAQYGLSLALIGGVLASNTMLEPSGAGWRGSNALDSEARLVLAAPSAQGRAAAGSASDILMYGLLAYPFVIDTALVAGIGHGNYDVAFQMAMIGVQAVLTAKLVSSLTKGLVGRARPDSEGCITGEELGCGTFNESFISGHTTTAFVGAGLICAQHQNLALYGDGPWGAVACGASLVAASAVGTLRIVADRHNLTDVLGGALVGLGAGYFMPNLLNYNFGEDRASHGQIAPFVSDRTVGVSYNQTF